MTGTVAIIVGAGRGRRFGGAVPKQYRDHRGEPLIRHALRAFAEHPEIDEVLAVINMDDEDLFHAAADGLDICAPISGGASRQDSVRNGLQHIAAMMPSRVLIHDAARPFVEADLISRVIAGLQDHEGAIPSIPVSDTLKRVADGCIVETVDRAELWRVQTPQGFKFREILAAHLDAAGLELTDDAAVAERAGLRVAAVEGSETNMKITLADDLAANAPSASSWEYRTGQGFDVHRFEAGDKVHICGVEIAHDAALAGHSDADVALHALTDALLGAIGDGDIGDHFPPSDPKWQGAASALFVEHAADRVNGLRGEIVHVDITIICELPKIGPHRGAMRARVAALLGIELSRISVKATTTERLGFTGRGEGIASQAVATVRLPEPD